MRIKIKSIAVATLVLFLFTILPLASPMLIPSEIYNAIFMMGGVDVRDLLDRVVVLGLAMAILILLRGSIDLSSNMGLAISITWKIFWLLIVIFILSIGKIENLGLAILGGGGNGAINIVTFDLRLFVVLVTVIEALIIARSILVFKESKKG